MRNHALNWNLGESENPEFNYLRNQKNLNLIIPVLMKQPNWKQLCPAKFLQLS